MIESKGGGSRLAQMIGVARKAQVQIGVSDRFGESWKTIFMGIRFPTGDQWLVAVYNLGLPLIFVECFAVAE